MMAEISVRRAVKSDVAPMAAILSDWIERTPWMPRLHGREVIEGHFRAIFDARDSWVAGTPVKGYVSLDPQEQCVTGLYCAQSGQGVGKALLDAAKQGRDALRLWTFAANDGARRFYAREGFCEIRRTEGENEEGLADILLGWERSQ